jgi:hypothetical protein
MIWIDTGYEISYPYRIMASTSQVVQVVQVKSSSSVNIKDSLHVCSPTGLYTVLQGCVDMNQGDYG